MEKTKDKKRIWIILGATASGKSKVALQVAARADAEIISMDSMQIYRGMDIGTAKPSRESQEKIPHHLIDLRDPWENFSTAQWLKLAEKAVSDVISRGKRPLFVGGTALYVKTLLFGMFEGPSADWEFRKGIRAEAARIGPEALHERLARIDPESAKRIHAHDLRRIERALEIYEKTGEKPSELRREWDAGEMLWDARVVGLNWPRERLYERINARVDAMMEAGWAGEVERLVSSERGMSIEASQALGYEDLASVVAGECEPAAAVEEIKKKTRRFAKRQETWFRGFGWVEWVGCNVTNGCGEIAGKVLDALFG